MAGERSWLVPDAVKLDQLPVYTTIHLVYDEITSNIDVPLSDEQLKSPEIAFNVLLPLEQLFASLNDPSIVYVLLLNRLHFVRERDSALSSSSLNETRARLCEVLAIKLLRHQATVKGRKGSQGNVGLLSMAKALVGGFQAFQGAPQDVLRRVRVREGFEAERIMADGAGKTNALELAILGQARTFIKSQACQRVIAAIWEGKIVYTSSSFLDILPDRWKIQDIKIYSLAQAPLLDHYRLRVPKYRSWIDFFAFLILFVSFLAVIIDRRKRHESRPVGDLTAHEIWFFTYALGYSLDKTASIAEHGWSVFSAGLTNGLDVFCLPIFGLAFGLRIHSILANSYWYSDQAFAVLSCAACLMFPRFAFAMISNNVLILSLRAMLADFIFLMLVASFCFLGFVFALVHLCNGDYSTSRIGEWLVFIWFGLDGTGIDLSGTFHPILGPLLFITYAALSNTLLVSILVAILSGTYANIAADAAAEDMFRRAVLTFEGVKCDSLFDYMPPLNILALGILWPISKVTSYRWFHKINVAATRVLSLPILLLIAVYERQTAGGRVGLYLDKLRARLIAVLPRKWAQKLSLLEGAHWECEAVFEYRPDSDDEFDSSGEQCSYHDDDDEGEDTLLPMGSDDEIEDILEAEGGGIPPRRLTPPVAGGTIRKSSRNRASEVISTAPPPLPQSGSSRASSSTLLPASSSPSPEADPIPSSSTSSTPPPPIAITTQPPTPIIHHASPPPHRQRVTHARTASGHAHSRQVSTGGFNYATHERLPSNASTSQQALGVSGAIRIQPRPEEPDSPASLSSSAPQNYGHPHARFESPLAKLYHHFESGAAGGGGAASGEGDMEGGAAAMAGLLPGGTGGLRRRMSLGVAGTRMIGGVGGTSSGEGLPRSTTTITTGTTGVEGSEGTAQTASEAQLQLLELVRTLVEKVDSLESKLGKSARLEGSLD